MACFAQDITRPDNNFSQIGDNDSGMFFNLTPYGKLISPAEAKTLYSNLKGYIPQESDDTYFDESMNDCRPFISAVGGVL